MIYRKLEDQDKYLIHAQPLRVPVGEVPNTDQYIRQMQSLLNQNAPSSTKKSSKRDVGGEHESS